MPDADRSTARTVGVIALVVLAGVALRGYLPGAEPQPDDPASRGSGALVPVVAMVALAVAVIAVAVVGRRRDPVVRPNTTGELPRGAGAAGGRWTPRMLFVVVAAALLWLLVVALLMHLSDGLRAATDQPVTVEAPPTDTAGAASGDDPPPPEQAEGPRVIGYLAAGAAVLVGLSVLTSLSRRPRPPAGTALPAPPPADPPVSGTQTLARAAERGLAEIGDLSREPREAIIACYAAMERELAKSPTAMPLDSDTPSEVLARAVERGLLPAGNATEATELVDLFEEARFSRHVMDEDHRHSAVRVLRLVLDGLQATATGTA